MNRKNTPMKRTPIIIILLLAVFASCERDNSGKDGEMNFSLSTEEAEASMDSEFGAEAEESESYKWAADDGNSDVTYQDKVVSSATANNGYVGTSSVPNKDKTPEYDQKIIRSARIGMELDNYQKGKEKIMQLLHKHNAILADENETSSYSQLSNRLTIKVPSKSFDKLMADLGNGIGHFDYKQINSKDVGEEYYDLEARIKTKKAVMHRYQSFLHKAKNIEELLKIEFEIRKLQEEIEAKEGRIKYLSNRVSFSTIHLNIYQNLDFDKPIQDRPGFGNKMLSALQSDWTSILKLIINLAYGWPYLLIFGFGFYFLYKKVIRKRL